MITLYVIMTSAVIPSPVPSKSVSSWLVLLGHVMKPAENIMKSAVYLGAHQS